MVLTEPFGQYFQWWQSAATRYLDLYQQQPFFLRSVGVYMERYLEFKKAVDRVMEETWRNFRFPTVEDITRVHERLNFLESRLVALQEVNQAQEVAALLENLKSLNRALGDIKKEVAEARESGEVK